MTKSYKIIDYLTYKISQLERNRSQRAYKQCLKALELIYRELKKFADTGLGESRSNGWDARKFIIFFEKYLKENGEQFVKKS